jgi:hypothetical protein
MLRAFNVMVGNEKNLEPVVHVRIVINNAASTTGSP